ncbi:Mur ligase [Bimuria novae-zelandiae CBS 107.79]|uniref:Mur ligase n=1 Tax=Bimuria novae-zelandiae CBS 107.79 TaxID=1447943 RepID=A0A6A5V0F9_9PLEO|nr:Mur ligase [Bimuria novae-zelandiae CBS 107.79]
MIQPGLERISRLLQNVQFPWKAVHVAGTNGKGSICGLTSHLLTRRCIKNGRFTSPHLVNRWDCININSEPVSEREFRKVEDHFINLNQRENINASEFELLTATAFTLFNENKVDVGVIEVGMGGKLDATNILNNQVVSVIAKIARDHQGFLGDTLEEIASHKAGILRPNVPYLVNPMNDIWVHQVIEDYAREIGAGPRILVDTQELSSTLFKSAYFKAFAEGKLPYQLDNAVMAFLAYLQVLRSMDLSADWKQNVKILKGLKNKTVLQGRQHSVKVPVVFGSFRQVLVDGAHNEDAADTLRDYVKKKLEGRPPSKKYESVDSNGKWPITWVIAMTEGRDPRAFLRKLLKPGDNIITTSFNPVEGMPWVKPLDPKVLLSVAKELRPDITGLAIPKRGVYRALCAAKYLSPSAHIVLTGSLYLVGDFFREHQVAQEGLLNNAEFPSIRQIDMDEKERVEAALLEKVAERQSEDDNKQAISRPVRIGVKIRESEEAKQLRLEIERLEEEMKSFGFGEFTPQSTPSLPPAKVTFPESVESTVPIRPTNRTFDSRTSVAFPDRQIDGSEGNAPARNPLIRYHEVDRPKVEYPAEEHNVRSQDFRAFDPKSVTATNFAKSSLPERSSYKGEKRVRATKSSHTLSKSGHINDSEGRKKTKFVKKQRSSSAPAGGEYMFHYPESV